MEILDHNGNANLKQHQLTKEDRVRGAKKTAEVKKNKKTVAEFLRVWADGDLSEKEKNILQDAGFGEDLNRRCLLLMPLLTNIKKGDIRSLGMALELLQEDRKKEKEIEKLKEEIALLKLQQETEKQKASYSDLLKDKVIVNMDVVPTKKDD